MAPQERYTTTTRTTRTRRQRPLLHASFSEYDESSDSFQPDEQDKAMVVCTPAKEPTFLPRTTTGLSLVELARAEIQELRHRQAVHAAHLVSSSSSQPRIPPPSYLGRFPTACAALVQSMPGNHCCVDCGARHPTWAAVSYGALLCLHCSGHHRSLGVRVSSVCSLDLDHVSVQQVLSLLEGGNDQWRAFLERHLLTPETLPPQSSSRLTAETVVRLRYKTKAALFYRQQLQLHVQGILQHEGPYQGRRRQPQGPPHVEPSSSSATARPSPERRTPPGRSVSQQC